MLEQYQHYEEALRAFENALSIFQNLKIGDEQQIVEELIARITVATCPYHDKIRQAKTWTHLPMNRYTASIETQLVSCDS